MAKRIRLTIVGHSHDVDLETWKKSKPVIAAGAPHNDGPLGTLQLGLGPNHAIKVCVRTNDQGDLLLEFD
jgi:hypothetical protein